MRDIKNRIEPKIIPVKNTIHLQNITKRAGAPYIAPQIIFSLPSKYRLYSIWCLNVFLVSCTFSNTLMLLLKLKTPFKLLLCSRKPRGQHLQPVMQSQGEDSSYLPSLGAHGSWYCKVIMHEKSRWDTSAPDSFKEVWAGQEGPMMFFCLFVFCNK